MIDTFDTTFTVDFVKMFGFWFSVDLVHIIAFTTCVASSLEF